MSIPTPEQAQDLVEWAGTTSDAAREIGVPRSTVAHWLNPEPGHARSRAYYAANREAEGERLRRYHAANRERRRAQMRDWYWGLSGVEYNRLRLRERRNKGLKRIEQRRERQEA